MDSEQREIPVVEDDMGEGIVEPINDLENEFDKLQRKLWREEEKVRRRMSNNKSMHKL